MSTRGAFGFYKNGLNKITYNHFDSYQSGLGLDIINFIMKNTIEDMNNIFDNINLVKGTDIPTLEDIKEIAKFKNIDINKLENIDNFEDLIGDMQEIDCFRKGFNYMIDDKEFMADSLFCEYAYIINLDDNTLEVYEGFNKIPTGNRYSKFVDENSVSEEYKEVKLVGKIKLRELQTMEFGMYKDNEELENFEIDC